MKTVSRLSAFILGAAVLLSGCDNSVPAETSSVTEEITTTAATTAAVSEITAATAETTAAPIELKALPEEVTKTFGIRTEYRNSGNENESPRSPFDHFYYAADSEVYYPEFAAPMETFMTELRSNEMCADAVGLIEPYADGDVLIPFMLRSLPYTGLCHIFDAKPVGGCYKLGDEYLLYISDPENVTLYRKDPHWTECRRGIELLWANYDILKPLSVTAVYDAETAEEMAQAQVKMNHCWLEISASAETIEAVKKAFDDNGTDKYCFEYVVDPDAADVSPDYTSSSADNWELPDFVKPESWQELYTFDEALEHIDEIKKYGQTDYSEQMIVRLMNRNNIAFHTEIVSGIFDVEHGGENSPDNLYKATSPYFDSLDSIGEFLRDTYTSETADLWIYGSEDRKPPYIEKDDGLYLDAMNAPVWNDDPFEGRTYIEVIGSDSRKITFNWHYISWELFGFDNKDRKVWTPHHLQMQFTAVKENGEWRLPMIIFDNPEFSRFAEENDTDITGYTKIPYDSELPHTVTTEKLDIFDKAFYGVWTNSDGEKADLTYNAFDCKIFGDTTVSIWDLCETENAYVMVLFEGGVCRYLYILKESPDILYDSYDWLSHDGGMYLNLQPVSEQYTDRDTKNRNDVNELRKRAHISRDTEQRLEDEQAPAEKRFMYKLHRTDKGWEVGEFTDLTDTKER